MGAQRFLYTDVREKNPSPHQNNVSRMSDSRDGNNGRETGRKTNVAAAKDFKKERDPTRTERRTKLNLPLANTSLVYEIQCRSQFLECGI